MALLTAQDYAAQIIAQLRILDPSVSAEINTPERKIIDTVSQALADNQIDITGLQGALDIDAKYGTNLDRFTALFGFARQVAQASTGFVIFSRNSPAPANVAIPVGAIIQSSAATSDGQFLQYTTTTGGVIAQGATDSGAIPIQCVTTGLNGNAAANTITVMVGTPIIGVTSVTNANALVNGRDGEDDNSYKVRFKNTWARNLAGTSDQYLALAVSSAVTTKANVVGVQSRYQEYIQIPNYDDAGYLNGAASSGLWDGNPADGKENTGGAQGQWTTALSSIPYAKQIFAAAPAFVTNGQSGAAQYFYRPDNDFQFNPTPLLVGDAFREGGVVSVAPNFTFLNVFNPVAGTLPIPGLQAVAPGSIVLAEFGYVSAASRNDINHNITNAVDVFVNGSSDITASCIFLPNVANTQFNSQPTSAYYQENYRRDGQPTKRPILGNFYIPLYNTPLDTLPDTITVAGQNYYLGHHYWLVHEVGPNSGTVRARDGIEWSQSLGGDAGSQLPPANALAPYTTTGTVLSPAIGFGANTPVEVDDYQYDSNIIALQSAMEDAKQITTDVLVHKAKSRYFVLDVTVMYTGNANYATINSAMGTSLQAFLDRQYFGTTIQLSDLLETLHEVSGVDNVRWSNDLIAAPDLIRVLETDNLGVPLHGASIDRITPGTVTTPEVQRLFIAGQPSGVVSGVSDSFTLSWTDPSTTGLTTGVTTAPIPFFTVVGAFQIPVTAAAIQSAIQAVMPSGASPYHYPTVVADNRPSTGVTQPLRSFTITYASAGPVYLPSVVNNVTSSQYTYDTDFFLQDNELPMLPSLATSLNTGGVPGLIIRPRAQNTWSRPGLG